jgi:hypothetical protein
MSRTFVATPISVTQEQSKSYAIRKPAMIPLALMSLQLNGRNRPLKQITYICSYIDTCQCPNQLDSPYTCFKAIRAR